MLKLSTSNAHATQGDILTRAYQPINQAVNINYTQSHATGEAF